MDETKVCPERPNFCIACGEKLEPSESFCTQCGKAVPQRTQGHEKKVEPQNKFYRNNPTTTNKAIQEIYEQQLSPLQANIVDCWHAMTQLHGSVYTYPNIPEGIFDNIEADVEPFDENEPILGVQNNTLLSSTLDGAVFTTTGVYWKNRDGHHGRIRYTDILSEDVIFELSTLGTTKFFVTRKQHIELELFDDPDTLKKLVSFVRNAASLSHQAFPGKCEKFALASSAKVRNNETKIETQNGEFHHEPELEKKDNGNNNTSWSTNKHLIQWLGIGLFGVLILFWPFSKPPVILLGLGLVYIVYLMISMFKDDVMHRFATESQVIPFHWFDLFSAGMRGVTDFVESVKIWFAVVIFFIVLFAIKGHSFRSNFSFLFFFTLITVLTVIPLCVVPYSVGKYSRKVAQSIFTREFGFSAGGTTIFCFLVSLPIFFLVIPLVLNLLSSYSGEPTPVDLLKFFNQLGWGGATVISAIAFFFGRYLGD